MFLQACVSHSVHRRGTIPACNWVAPPWTQMALSPDSDRTPPDLDRMPPDLDRTTPWTWTETWPRQNLHGPRQNPGPRLNLLDPDGIHPDPDGTRLDQEETPRPRWTPHTQTNPPPELDGTPPQVYKRAARILVESFLILFASCCKMKTGKLCMWFREK